jgi:hypothetical protein
MMTATTNPIDRNSALFGYIQGYFHAHAAPLPEIPAGVRRHLLTVYRQLDPAFIDAVLTYARMSQQQTISRMQVLARIEDRTL